MNMFLVVALITGLSTFSLYAEDNDPGAEAIEADTGSLQQAVQPPATRVTGALELRPSVSRDKTYTQNTIELGYKFNPNLSIGYTQYFETNFFDGQTQGLGLIGNDGFLRLKLANVWESAAKDLSLGFETRVYMPTYPDRAAQGYLGMWRNYATLTWKPTSRFSVTMQEIPIVYAFDRPGTYAADGTPKGSANAIFENRIYIIPAFDITQKLSLSFPILLNMMRHRNFDVAAGHNDNWSFVLWTWPEITYAIAPKSTLGLAFMSENLMTDNLGSFALGGKSGGISTGSTQLILRQDL
jgi:hypothetical protein